MSVDFDALPDSSHIWVFQSDRALQQAEIRQLSGFLEAFLQVWRAHGKELQSAYKIVERIFLVVAVNDAIQKATGCSIDLLFRKIGEWERGFGLTFTNRWLTAYRHGGEIKIASLSAFKEAVQSGEITRETVVFNTVVPDKKAFQNYFETRAAQSWHKRYLV